MKAVIETGGKQYIVEKGDTIEIEQLGDVKTVTFEPLMLIDDKDTKVGAPFVSGASVKAKVLDARKLSKKVTIMKFKAKKRVHTKNGHRQPVSVVEISEISTK